MKKILYLCHRIPYPPNKGDKIRSFNEIKYLSKNNTIDLITLADDLEDLKYEENLKKYCNKIKVFSLNKKLAKIKGFINLLFGQSISQGYFYQQKFQSTFNQWIDSEQYDALICFSSPMAEYIFKSPKKNNEIAKTLIMDFCDLDSDKWHQYARKTSFPLNMLYKKEAVRLLEFEKKINKAFHKSIFVSQKEADLFKAYYSGLRNIQIISNGVDENYFNPEKTEKFKDKAYPIIAFFGAMDYYANVDGALWFIDKILPIIKNEVPGIVFFIVGSNPDKRLRALASDPGIKVTGFVEDIREYYKTVDVCVIPLRIARGVQNKVLEALAMGKAVVTTSQAVQGICISDHTILKIEDEPEFFAKQVIHILQEESLRKDMGETARNYIKENFNWDKNMKELFQN